MRRRAVRISHPAQAIALSFAVAFAAGTILLMLPFASTTQTDVVTAMFTTASAVCVTGLAVVDTPSHWTMFGKVVILGLIQAGGLGIMTFASLIAILLSRRLGLRSRLTASATTRTTGMEDVRRVVRTVVTIGFTVEAVVAVVLFVRFLTAYSYDVPRAAWYALFHAVSAFNNAGFALYSDSLMGFVADPWICLPIAAAVIVGGIGFPVLIELRRTLGRRLSMSTSLVLLGTAVLLLGGWLAVMVLEWNNPATFGDLDGPARVLAAFVASTMSRTAGFNSVDIGAMLPETLLTQDILMFIGAGPAGTAGGIKITTFGVLFFILLTELKGEGAVNVFRRRLPRSVHREALTVALLSVAVVIATTGALLWLTDASGDQAAFEAISAFGTVGLSTGITADIPDSGRLLLTLVMFIGRLGPLTLGTSLALRSEKLHYELPKERPLIG
ncbi:MAG: TrkH family potassium uptake protein [Beutenbergiaceae bacterium]